MIKEDKLEMAPGSSSSCDIIVAHKYLGVLHVLVRAVHM